MAAALARGEIGTEHVVAAANAAKRISPEEADQLVDDAVAAPADLFLKRTRQWIGQHETGDEIEDRYQHQRSQREARWGVGNDRMLHLHAVLDPVSGRELVAALDRRVNALWRAVRLASRAQWIALIDRDRGCQRCGDPPSRCDAHHIHEYSAGGATNIDNLELDCHGDHTLIHQHGFDPRRQPANRGAG